jgi:hypothetical protein
MPSRNRTRPATITFEAISAPLRPGGGPRLHRAAREGLLHRAHHLRPLRRDPAGRGHHLDRRPGTSIPALAPENPPPAPAQALSAQERARYAEQRAAQLDSLEGTAVRARWPSGHERTDVLARRDRYSYELSELRVTRHDPLPRIEQFKSRDCQPAPPPTSAAAGTWPAAKPQRPCADRLLGLEAARSLHSNAPRPGP